MSSPDRRAVELVFNSMRDRFLEEQTPCEVLFGWAEANRRNDKTLNRVVWVPGDGENIGAILPPKGPGGPDRSLMTLGELFSIEIFGVDASQRDSELAQYSAARRLLDAVLRALYLAYGPRVNIVKSNWVNVLSTVRSNGKSIRLVIVIQSTVVDAPFGDVSDSYMMTTANADETAELDVSEGTDTQESF